MAHPIDKKRLARLMMLAAAENDGEALNALRAANRLLADAGMNWEQLIRGHRITESYTNQREIDEMFNTILVQAKPGKFRAFVEDVQGYWKEKGYLTPAQYRCLAQAVKRCQAPQWPG